MHKIDNTFFGRNSSIEVVDEETGGCKFNAMVVFLVDMVALMVVVLMAVMVAAMVADFDSAVKYCWFTEKQTHITHGNEWSHSWVGRGESRGGRSALTLPFSWGPLKGSSSYSGCPAHLSFTPPP